MFDIGERLGHFLFVTVRSKGADYAGEQFLVTDEEEGYEHHREKSYSETCKSRGH